MYRFLLFNILLFGINFQTNAQELDWVAQQGESGSISRNLSLAVDPFSGNVATAGVLDNDIVFANYGPTGDLIWSKSIQNLDKIHTLNIDYDNSGNVYLAGSFVGTDVDFDPSPNQYLISSLSTGTDIYLAKYDELGGFQWAFTFGGDDDKFESVSGLVVQQPFIYITGGYSGSSDIDPTGSEVLLTSNGEFDIYLISYTTDAELNFGFNIGSVQSDAAFDLTKVTNGDIVITGFFEGTVDFDPGPATSMLNSVDGQNLYLAKYNFNGEFRWAFSLPDVNLGLNVRADYDENLVVYGRCIGSGGTTIDIDPSGDEYLLELENQSFAEFLASYDSDGNIRWGEASNIDEPNFFDKRITIDASNNVILTGLSQDSNALIEYDQDGNLRGSSSFGDSDTRSSFIQSNTNSFYISGGFSEDSNFGIQEDEILTSAGTTDGFISKYFDFSVSDSLALVALYNSTAGPSWINNANWLTGPLSTWYGVTITNRRVTRIDLAGNNLLGTLPEQIGDLSALQYLYLGVPQGDGNEISGVIPQSISQLQELVVFSIPFNELQGTIPTGIGDLVKLETIYLRDNDLTGEIPSSIGNISDLKVLELSENNLIGSIPEQVLQISSLQELDLGFNDLIIGPIPSEIYDLVNLTDLGLAYTGLTGTISASIANLINMEYLDLRGGQLEGNIPTEMGQLVNLFDLSLSQNSLSGSIPASFGNLTNLRFLFLAQNQLSGSIPPELGNINNPNLRGIELSDNQLSGAVPSTFQNLTNIEGIWLQNNDLETLPDLSNLDLTPDDYWLEGLRVENNKFEFDDLEPNIGLNEFKYIPQQNFGVDQEILKEVGESLTISYTVGGSQNKYQWYKDGLVLPGQTLSTLQISSLDASNQGYYQLEAINNLVPGLTIYSAETSLIVQVTEADIKLSNLEQVYTGESINVDVETIPSGLNYVIRYNGAQEEPVNSGTYNVEVTIVDDVYEGFQADILNIYKAEATLSISNLTQEYDGKPKAVTVKTTPVELNTKVTYNGSEQIPIEIGMYEVMASVDDKNYFGESKDTLRITKATAEIVVTNTVQSYDGFPKTVKVQTTPEDLEYLLVFKDIEEPIDAGTYPFEVNITDEFYKGTEKGNLLIENGGAEIIYSNTIQTYDGTPKQITVNTEPEGLNFVLEYTDLDDFPINAGKYRIYTEIVEENWIGSKGTYLTIEKQIAEILISNLEQSFDGQPKEVNISTVPDGLKYIVLYDGKEEPPINEGVYMVQASIDEENFEGSSVAELIISTVSGLDDEFLSEIKISPNPADQYIRIQTEGDIKIENVYISNSDGKVLESNSFTSQQSIFDISQFAPGVYIVIFEIGGELYSKQLIIH